MDAFMYLKNGKAINTTRLSKMEPSSSEHLGQGDRLAELPLLDSGCPPAVQAPTACDSDKQLQSLVRFLLP